MIWIDHLISSTVEISIRFIHDHGKWCIYMNNMDTSSRGGKIGFQYAANAKSSDTWQWPSFDPKKRSVLESAHLSIGNLLEDNNAQQHRWTGVKMLSTFMNNSSQEPNEYMASLMFTNVRCKMIIIPLGLVWHWPRASRRTILWTIWNLWFIEPHPIWTFWCGRLAISTRNLAARWPEVTDLAWTSLAEIFCHQHYYWLTWMAPPLCHFWYFSNPSVLAEKFSNCPWLLNGWSSKWRSIVGLKWLDY